MTCATPAISTTTENPDAPTERTSPSKDSRTDVNDKYYDCLLDFDQSQIDVDLSEQIQYFDNFDNTCCKGIKGS